jgi:hypothetical protein
VEENVRETKFFEVLYFQTLRTLAAAEEIVCKYITKYFLRQIVLDNGFKHFVVISTM